MQREVGSGWRASRVYRWHASAVVSRRIHRQRTAEGRHLQRQTALVLRQRHEAYLAVVRIDQVAVLCLQGQQRLRRMHHTGWSRRRLQMLQILLGGLATLAPVMAIAPIIGRCHCVLRRITLVESLAQSIDLTLQLGQLELLVML